MFKPRLILLVTIVLVGGSFVAPTTAQVIRNAQFENQTNWWFGWGGAEIQQADTGYLSETSCKVSGREHHWNGAAQEITGRLESGKDYHFQAWVKPVGDNSGIMRFQVFQADNRGKRDLTCGEVFAAKGEWTRLQGGFTVDPNGPITTLTLIVSNADDDPQKFDFMLDAVSIAENDWRAAADARIEKFRKRDVKLSFVDAKGGDPGPLTVDVRQIGSHFRFGSALNEAHVDNETYAEFFRDHFENATVEWRTQWKPVEEVRGTEDWTLGDKAVEFCRENAIDVKGHAIVWPHEKFCPAWLIGLSDEELRAELDQRLVSAVGRYKGQLVSWDVINEMLHWSFFEDRLGETARADIFRRAEELDPNALLSTNEYDLAISEARSRRYRDLIESIDGEAPVVDCIGFQSHFKGFVSPKGMEIAMSQLSDLEKDIWFTEFDVTNPDPQQRAKSLEDFYRFAFSQPKAIGVTMWGFWAGTHWRGADASIVDEDWTINAAGKKYFELIESWTTKTVGPAEDNAYSFRGFHGDYLVTTIAPDGAQTFHLVTVEPGQEPLSQELVVGADNTFSLNGTSGDDLFEFDLGQFDSFMLNGRRIDIEVPVAGARLRLLGLGGEDRVVFRTPADPRQNVIVSPWFVRLASADSDPVFFDAIENVVVEAMGPNSTARLYDSPTNDLFDAWLDRAVMQTPDVELTASNFRYMHGLSRWAEDQATLHDTSFADRVLSDLSLTLVRSGAVLRRVTGFTNTTVISGEGDLHNLRFPLEPNDVEIREREVVIRIGNKVFEFNGSNRVFLRDHVDSVRLTGTTADDTLTLRGGGHGVFRGNGFYVLMENAKSITVAEDSPGNDHLRIVDSAGDDSLLIDKHAVQFFGADFDHNASFFERVSAISIHGGIDQVFSISPKPEVGIAGAWQDVIDDTDAETDTLDTGEIEDPEPENSSPVAGMDLIEEMEMIEEMESAQMVEMN